MRKIVAVRAAILRHLRRVLSRLYRSIVLPPLSPAQQDFIAENTRFWGSLQERQQEGADGGYILVSVEFHPIIHLSDASFASIVALARGQRLLFVSTMAPTHQSRRLLQSFPNAKFLHLGSPRYWPMRLMAWLLARRAYREIRTPLDLLAFRVDGIRFGDALYDAVLAKGFATIDRIDGRTLTVLRRFYFLRAFIRHVLRRYRVQAGVFAHLIGVHGSTFSRYLLQREIEVLNRVGSHELLVKKYRSLVDVGIYPVRPERRYFELMLKRDDETIQRQAEEYLNRRFSDKIEDATVSLAFDTRKRHFPDRSAFAAAYGLDPVKPFVFVLLHAFNDYPHSHFARPMIFQDYYHWFKRTLEIARTVDSVNWVFKEHPAARYYPTRDLDLAKTFSTVTDDNILFLPRDANFNARSIGDLALAIVTCVGTGGLEYAALGIPCVLGGESGYSSFGFTIEPRDAEEYEACLRQIGALGRLTAAQVRRAKLVAYFYFCVTEGAVFYFCPRFSDEEISEWNLERDERLWRVAGAAFRDGAHREKLRRQVERLTAFVNDRQWTQYVDFERFPFLEDSARTTASARSSKSGSVQGDTSTRPGSWRSERIAWTDQAKTMESHEDP